MSDSPYKIVGNGAVIRTEVDGEIVEVPLSRWSVSLKSSEEKMPQTSRGNKTCMYCGESGLHWELLDGEGFRLFDSQGEKHDCLKFSRARRRKTLGERKKVWTPPVQDATIREVKSRIDPQKITDNLEAFAVLSRVAAQAGISIEEASRLLQRMKQSGEITSTPPTKKKEEKKILRKFRFEE